ncbi:MAG: 2Fe-2S iron-sulfur cluster-binding protein [Myxococcota bacterium]
MAKVRFEPSSFETTVTPGTALLDVTDEHPDADVPYSCRSASCGTCRVEVVEGADAMLPAEDDELDVLEIFGDEPGVRLCCQLTLAKETDQIVLRVVDPA